MATRVNSATRWIVRTASIAVLVFVGALWLAGGPVMAQRPADHHPVTSFSIGPEDVLDISVYGDEGLARIVPVRPDGKISLPLVSDIQAAGLTPTELRDALVVRLSEYISAPQVSVIVREVHSFKVGVLGEVRTPGRYEMKSRTTVLDVLAQAGGFSEFASRSRILILRAEGDTLVRIPFDYNQLVSDDGSKQNVYLRPGDTVVVP
jgi:polysaccharide export outer membrane protein